MCCSIAQLPSNGLRAPPTSAPAHTHPPTPTPQAAAVLCFLLTLRLALDGPGLLRSLGVNASAKQTVLWTRYVAVGQGLFAAWLLWRTSSSPVSVQVLFAGAFSVWCGLVAAAFLTLPGLLAHPQRLVLVAAAVTLSVLLHIESGGAYIPSTWPTGTGPAVYPALLASGIYAAYGLYQLIDPSFLGVVLRATPEETQSLKQAVFLHGFIQLGWALLFFTGAHAPTKTTSAIANQYLFSFVVGELPALWLLGGGDLNNTDMLMQIAIGCVLPGYTAWKLYA